MARNKDLADLTRRLNAIPKRVRAAVQPAIDNGADELVARMKYLAPEGADGQLKAWIKAERNPTIPLATRVSASDTSTSGGGDNALYQEYGTVNQDRNSFFWPSVITLKKRVRGRIDRAISKAVKEAWD